VRTHTHTKYLKRRRFKLRCPHHETATLQRQFERRQQLEAYRKSPRYKLDKLLEKQQALLEIWEKKAKQVDRGTETGQNGTQTPEGEPGLMGTKVTGYKSEISQDDGA